VTSWAYVILPAPAKKQKTKSDLSVARKEKEMKDKIVLKLNKDQGTLEELFEDNPEFKEAHEKITKGVVNVKITSDMTKGEQILKMSKFLQELFEGKDEK